MAINGTRRDAVRSAMDRIREIQNQHEISRDSLQLIKSELLELARHAQWFTVDDFPPPEESEHNSCIYRLAEDERTQANALYIQTAVAPLDVPAHYHDTWAVIVGIKGTELNKFYERTDDGVREVESYPVCEGTGVTMLPDDLHSIHVHDEQPVINFHMYGLALEQLVDREFYDRKARQWKKFPVFEDVREARNFL